jgi:hypothetical protein
MDPETMAPFITGSVPNFRIMRDLSGFINLTGLPKIWDAPFTTTDIFLLPQTWYTLGPILMQGVGRVLINRVVPK